MCVCVCVCMCMCVYIYIYIYRYGGMHWVRCMCTVVEDFDTGDWSGVKVKLPAGYQVMSR